VEEREFNVSRDTYNVSLNIHIFLSYVVLITREIVPKISISFIYLLFNFQLYILMQDFEKVCEVFHRNY